MTFVVLWWMNRDPYYAEFTLRDAADAAANVRNGVVLVLRGGHVREAFDWWRRDENGRPLPFANRDLPVARPCAPRTQ